MKNNKKIFNLKATQIGKRLQNNIIFEDICCFNQYLMEHCWHVEVRVSLAGKSLCKYSANTEEKAMRQQGRLKVKRKR